MTTPKACYGEGLSALGGQEGPKGAQRRSQTGLGLKAQSQVEFDLEERKFRCLEEGMPWSGSSFQKDHWLLLCGLWEGQDINRDPPRRFLAR